MYFPKTKSTMFFALLFAVLFATVTTSESQTQRTTPRTTSNPSARQTESFRISRLAHDAEAAGNYEKALEYWQTVFSYDPNSYSGYAGIRRSMGYLRRWDELLEFQTKLEQDVNAGKYSYDKYLISTDRLETLYLAGKEAEMHKDAERLIAQNRHDSRVYREVSRVYTRLNEFEHAVEVLSKARKEFNNKYLYALELAKWAEQRMQWENAVQEYLLYFEESPDRLDYTIGALGDIMQQMPDNRQVFLAIESSFKDDSPKSEHFHLLLASLCLRDGQFEKAYEYVKVLEKRRGNPGDETVNFAKLLQLEGQYEFAISVYNSALEFNLRPNLKGDALLGIANSFESLDMIDSAFAVYESIVDADYPVAISFAALVKLGQISKSISQFEQARQYFASALQLAQRQRLPQAVTDEVSIELALAHAAEANFVLAEKSLRTVVNRTTPRYKPAVLARWQLVRIAFWKGDLDALTQNINNLLSSDPTSEHANDCLRLKALLSDFKSNSSIIVAFGNSDFLSFSNRLEEAQTSLEKMIQDHPNAAEEALWRLYRIQEEAGDAYSALEILERILKLEAGLRKDLALYQAGELCYQQLGDSAKALYYWEELLVLYSDSPLVDKTRRSLRTISTEVIKSL